MKKKLILMCSLIFVIIMIPVVLACFAFGVTPQYDESFYGGMAIKYNRLKRLEEKKVVVIGGSSVAFGLRSDILENELGIPVVNFGLYANLGTKFMLDVAKDYIKDSDIVIIAPEQSKQSLSTYFNGEAAWYASDGCFEILTKVGKDNRVDVAKQFLSFTSDKFNYWHSGNKPSPSGVYNVSSFNEIGDITFSRPYNTMKDGYDASTPITFSKEIIDEEFINYLNNYHAELNKVGAHVYFSFCPMNNAATAEDFSAEQMSDYYNYLTEKLNFGIIGNPQTHLLDEEWFFDTNFHLNDAGAIYYTSIVAQELKAEIDDFSPIKTSVPEKPQKPDDGSSGTEFSEELTEAAKIFELSGVEISTKNGELSFVGEWTIDGLTEYGKTLDKIEIPDSLVGIPVSAISNESFKDCANLTEIIFGENIASVGLNAFFGCNSLKGIYITSLNPDLYHVSTSIFDGLSDDCFIYVPEVAFTDYKYDYSWGFVNSVNRLKAY